MVFISRLVSVVEYHGPRCEKRTQEVSSSWLRYGQTFPPVLFLPPSFEFRLLTADTAIAELKSKPNHS